MTRNELNIGLGAVLSAAAEVGEPAPLTFLYLPLQASMGWDLEDFYSLTGILSISGLAEVTSDTLTLTQAGRDMAAKIDAHMAAQRAQS